MLISVMNPIMTPRFLTIKFKKEMLLTYFVGRKILGSQPVLF